MAERPEVAHEPRDVPVRAVVGFGVGLLVAAVAIHVGIWLFFRFLQERAERRDTAPTTLAARRPVEGPHLPERLFPEPRLERFPFAARESLRKEEDARLTSYGWVDRNHGVVRIPIEKAMELIARRGVPPATGGAPAPAAAPAAAAGAAGVRR
jgi:hypothetical protein